LEYYFYLLLFIYTFFSRKQLACKQELGMQMFEVLTAVLLKIQFSWNMRLCRRVDGSWRFEGTLGTTI